MDYIHTIEGDIWGTPIMKLQIVLHELKNMSFNLDPWYQKILIWQSLIK